MKILFTSALIATSLRRGCKNELTSFLSRIPSRTIEGTTLDYSIAHTSLFTTLSTGPLPPLPLQSIFTFYFSLLSCPKPIENGRPAAFALCCLRLFYSMFGEYLQNTLCNQSVARASLTEVHRSRANFGILTTPHIVSKTDCVRNRCK